MSDSALLEQWADEYGVPHLRVIGSELFAPDLIAALPVTWAREQCVLPVRLDGQPTLVMNGPEGLSALQHASLAAGTDFQPAFATREVILPAIDAAYYAGKNTAPAAAAAAAPARPAAAAGTGEGSAAAPSVPPAPRPRTPAAAPVKPVLTSPETDLLIDNAEPAARFWNNTLLEAMRRGASDIHLEPLDDGSARLRFRVAGRLYEQPAPPHGMAAQLVSRIKVMASMDIAEHRLPQDGMAQVRIGDRAVDIRVSTVPTGPGERTVLRLLNRDDSLLPLTDLGMDGDVYAGFSRMLSLPNGILVVSGPTGSGKTTTLYAALSTLDSEHRNIMTIEDPIEYRLEKIAQIQVKPKIGLTFAAGLRTILRQDPDVVLVGETRDAETAEIAVRAALTGHLVFTTLHTNDAPSAIPRFLDMGIEPFLLASCLRGVLAQRLVRQVCPDCVEALPLDTPGLPSAELAMARAAGCDAFLRARGCTHCLEGYHGRLGIFEYLDCSGPVSEAIHDGRHSAAELRNLAREQGRFRPMADDAAEKLRRRLTTPAECVAAIGAL